MEKNANFYQTAGRALDVLCMFQHNDRLTLSEVSREMCLGTTITYRLLYTLQAKGFLEQDSITKIYSLGENVLLLGYRAIQSKDIKKLAHPILVALTKETCQESFFNVYTGQKSLCLDRVSSGNDLQAAMRAGTVYPPHKGASNRVLLAFLPEDELESCLKSIGEEENKDLRETLKEIRCRGYDFSVGQLSTGVFSIAFPILNDEQKLFGAISTGGPAFALTEETQKTITDSVRKAAQKLSRLMGAQ